ncbi:hypothetical protein [Pelagicoccus mobilis]|uniref:Uncharacterized protein n=1 Tax=Pelagicoccus mobilis TaxID=415221 RepID=A0A934RU68_9BACT|nr:hypothetical protein [Pelagicoccus mobilis]MBK1876476.1 hypothetical protein [Pelagicoccus mobilis]
MKTSQLALLLIGATAIGFGVGRFSSPKSENTESQAIENQATRITSAQEIQDQTKSSILPVIVPASGPQPLKSVDDILASESIVDAISHFDRHLENLSTDKAFSVLERLQSMPASRKKSILMNRLFHKWGQTDGAVAFETAQALEGRDRLRYLGEAAAGWSTTDIVASWDALMIASNEGALQQLPLGPMLHEVAKQDISLAMTLMSEAGGTNAGYNRFKSILRAAEENGQFGDVFNELVFNDDVPNKERYVRSLFEEWGKSDLNTPFQMLNSLGDDPLSNQAMAGIMRGWATIDGQGAFSYALANSNDPIVARSLPMIAKELVKSSTAEEMSTLFSEIKDVDQQNSIAKTIIGDLANADPHSAFEWASQLQDEKTRANSIARVIGTYAKNDYEGARDYYLTLDDPSTQLQAVTGLTYSQFRETKNINLSETFELIDAIDDADSREKAIERVAGIAKSLKKRDSIEFTDEYITMIEGRDDLSRSKKDKLIKPLLPNKKKKK